MCIESVITSISIFKLLIFRSIYINLYRKKFVNENKLLISYRRGKSMHYPESPKVTSCWIKSILLGFEMDYWGYLVTVVVYLGICSNRNSIFVRPRKQVFGEDSFFIHFDQGQGFGSPMRDEVSIMTSLSHCCIIRASTLNTLLHFHNGPTSLGRYFNSKLF